VRLVLRALLLLAIAWPAQGAEPVQQREVQAVFLLNLTRFIRWPERAFPGEEAPLQIGVMPDDPVGVLLAEAVRGETVGRRPIVVRLVRTPADLEGCHLVYFAKADLEETMKLLTPLRARPLLAVGDVDGFLRSGGHVQFFNRAGQVRLRLAAGNLKRAELSASAQLLRVAEVVD
jgi:hypothetical protein